MSTQTPFLIFCYEMFFEWWMEKQCSAYRLSPSKVNVLQIHIPHHQLILLLYGAPPVPENSVLPCHSPAPPPGHLQPSPLHFSASCDSPLSFQLQRTGGVVGIRGAEQHSFHVGVSCHAKWSPLITQQDQQGVPQPHLIGIKKHLLA